MQIKTKACGIGKEKQDITDFLEPTFPLEYLQLLEKYSEPTIKSYIYQFNRFLKYYKGIKPKDISEDQLREYIIFMVKERKLSRSTQNNAINAIKIYYHKISKKEIDDYYLPRPHKQRKLPKIINEQEVAKILKNVEDIRDKCMIFLIYSAGLTPSEIVYLKPGHIDSKRMKIFISSAKGDKDRYVFLSPKVLNLLREYYKRYHPVEWLFENSRGVQYSRRKLQKEFQIAVKKSGISKPATLTILKNSFAVHLIEKGIDVRYIQKILGHKHSKTTMKYLRVSKRDLSLIQSPLDNLDV